MEMEDRLSALPDGVLCDILSFLPTHEAIATSLLSKRWLSLCHSVPALDLDDEAFLQNGKPFSAFVTLAYAAILSRSVHQPLTRFRLHSGVRDFPLFHFKTWVNAAVQRGVRHLHIEVTGAIELPISVLSCRTLVVLKLCQLAIYTLESVFLPALKTLHLDVFSMSDTRFLATFLAGCPILEDLRASCMYFFRPSDGVMIQSMPKLVRADISFFFGFNIPLKALCNVKYLRIFLRLEFNKECFPMFHNLIDLELNIENYTKWHLVFEMLKRCPKLQNFVLHTHKFLESFSAEICACTQSVPECVSSQLRKCTILNYRGKECEVRFAKYILQNARSLRAMTIVTIHNLTSGNTYSSNLQEKFEMLQELAMCPRSSTTCKLLFK